MVQMTTELPADRVVQRRDVRPRRGRDGDPADHPAAEQALALAAAQLHHLARHGTPSVRVRVAVDVGVVTMVVRAGVVQQGRRSRPGGPLCTARPLRPGLALRK